MSTYKHMQSQQGFTLIELMIVVAIIGILAAIAIPMYQDYVAKSQASEAVSLLAAAKSNVETYITIHGNFPDGSSPGESEAELGIRTNGTYVTSIKFKNVSSTGSGTATGQIVAKFKGSNISSALASKKLIFERTSSAEWVCKTPSGGIDKSLLPAPCG